ncbi:MAG TPA: cation transporter, partial [Gammaproteobacteria bacterium]|nr:cation transporter [Gammaproteobacteria bacterium]
MDNLKPHHVNYQQARRATLIGAVINLLLSGIKVGVGVMGHSQALVADGVHSLSDLISDVMV